jgi:hypothetical protein
MDKYWWQLGEIGRSVFLTQTGLWERLKPEAERQDFQPDRVDP